jgi:uncharacterized protein YecT (DUF1311 family)
MDYWKKIFVIFLCLHTPINLRAGDSAEKACWNAAKTQLAMNECAGKEYRAADADMNAIYKKLIGLPDKAFTKALRTSQRAWLQYRNAQLATYYPDPKEYYVSVQPMCSAQILAEMTRRRVQELKKYLAQKEGDVCAPNVDAESTH